MANFEVDTSYDMTEYYTHVVNGADSADDAERLAREYIQNTYDQCHNIEIDAVREVHA